VRDWPSRRAMSHQGSHFLIFPELAYAGPHVSPLTFSVGSLVFSEPPQIEMYPCDSTGLGNTGGSPLICPTDGWRKALYRGPSSWSGWCSPDALGSIVVKWNLEPVLHFLESIALAKMNVVQGISQKYVQSFSCRTPIHSARRAAPRRTRQHSCQALGVFIQGSTEMGPITRDKGVKRQRTKVIARRSSGTPSLSSQSACTY